MNIAGTEINLEYKAFEIYVSGCNPPHCVGCQNPELWDFGVGTDYAIDLPRIKAKIQDAKANNLVSYVWLLGGEPLDQNLDHLSILLKDIQSCGLPIVLWTHYLSIPERLKDYIMYVKYGPYVQGEDAYTEHLFNIRLAGRSQYIDYCY